MILRQAPSRTFRSLFSTVRPASAQAQARTPVSFDDKLVRATAKVILDTTKGIDQGSIEWQRRQSRVEQLRNALGRHERANELLTTLRALALDEPDPEMRELAQLDVEPAVDQLEEARRELVKLVLAAPTHDRDEWSALVELKAGVGGSEAALFLATLLRMYQRCAARKGWRANVIEADRIQVTGGDAYKEAILEVTGTRAFETLRREAGVHRVQRVPQTESQGRVHTSTVSVIVLPTDPASGAGTSSTIPDSELFDPKDVKVETMRSRGAGGQHVNRTESAIRLTHGPTGISVSMQDSRSQHENRTKAYKVLRARLMDRKLAQEEADRRSVRLNQVKGADRSEKIRTYNFPQGRITDHRIPITSSGLEDAIEGGETLDMIVRELELRDEHDGVESILLEDE